MHNAILCTNRLKYTPVQNQMIYCYFLYSQVDGGLVDDNLNGHKYCKWHLQDDTCQPIMTSITTSNVDMAWSVYHRCHVCHARHAGNIASRESCDAEAVFNMQISQMWIVEMQIFTAGCGHSGRGVPLRRTAPSIRISTQLFHDQHKHLNINTIKSRQHCSQSVPLPLILLSTIIAYSEIIVTAAQ